MRIFTCSRRGRAVRIISTLSAIDHVVAVNFRLSLKSPCPDPFVSPAASVAVCYSARTTGVSTTCSATNQTCNSLVRDHIAHQQIICAVVPALERQARHCTSLFEHDFMGVEQS